MPSAGQAPRVRCPNCGAVFHLPKLAEGEELPHPDTFPGYRVVAIVGFGGMGTVYRAVQLSMEREVALKVLHQRYSHVPRFVERFEREATALAALNHPNIVAVIDRGRVGDTYYLVMEYVRGRTLRYLIRNKRLTVERAVEIAIQICDALQAAHGCGVVHRDIKPGNILVTPEGLVKVADFGIVHIAGDDKHAERERRTRLGTAKYMAPEQRGTGLVVDHRADIYALGITLYEMLTGQLPGGSPASAHNPAIPKPLDEIIERATREDREERFQSAVEMRDALEAVLASLKLEETSATAVLAPLEAARCPACGAVLGDADLDCQACGNRVREPCFRPGCGALNPVGAERCSVCSGHLKLMEGEQRARLEAALDKAKRLMADGRLAEARAELEPVQADPHAAFEDLRLRARELGRALGRAWLRQFAAIVGKSLVAAAAIALSATLYWLVGRTAPAKTQRTKPPQPATAVRPPAPRTPTPAPSRKPEPSRDPLREYLLAATGPRWEAVEPETRLAVACDVALMLGGPTAPEGLKSDVLAKLDSIAKGVQPRGGPSRGMLAVAIETLTEKTIDLLAREEALTGLMSQMKADFAAKRKATEKVNLRLALATRALQDALAAARAKTDPRPATGEQLLLLAVALDPPFGNGDLASAAGRVVRSARLLLGHLYAHKGQEVEPEFLEWARRRVVAAERGDQTTTRLASALEAMVLALAPRAAARGH